MAERKVLNKYFPPDFDPALIPKRESLHGKQIKVRIMLPMTIQCTICGEYIGRGKKFNGRMEIVEGMKYLGITIFRMYVKCTNCCAEIAFRTDPQHHDYIVESGATRNFEPWRQEKQMTAEALDEQINAETGDVMQQLENRTLESKREIDIVDALEEIKELSDKNEQLGLADLLQAKEERESKALRAVDDELGKEAAAALAERSTIIKRLDETKPKGLDTSSLFGSTNTAVDTSSVISVNAIAVKKRKRTDDKKKKKKKKHKKNKKSSKPKEDSMALLCAYSSDDSV